jgi:hypothetical protein
VKNLLADVKIGDTVWSLRLGECTVVQVVRGSNKRGPLINIKQVGGEGRYENYYHDGVFELDRPTRPPKAFPFKPVPSDNFISPEELKKLKKGDIVWSYYHGDYQKVDEIITTYAYPIRTVSVSTGSTHSFTWEGRAYRSHMLPMLFWKPVEFVEDTIQTVLKDML